MEGCTPRQFALDHQYKRTTHKSPMPFDVVTELGKLIRSQQTYIHQIMDEMDRSEQGRHYDMLDQHLDRQVLIRDLLIDSLETIIGGT